MKIQMKAKIGRLRRIFNYTALPLLGIYFAGPMTIASMNDRTKDIGEKLDIPTATIEGMTRGKTLILDPSTRSSAAFAYLMESSDLRKGIMEQSNEAARKSDRYDFVGFSYSHPLFGQRGYVDQLTQGRTGKYSPCYIFFPSDRFDLDLLYDAASGGLPVKEIVNKPGTRNDYLKLVLFHELEHCNQHFRAKAEDREFQAEKASIDRFLAQGGDPEVVRATLYLRTLGTLSLIAFNGPRKKDDDNHEENKGMAYNIIPTLYARYFGGVEISTQNFETVEEEVFNLLRKTGTVHHLDGTDLLLHKNLYFVIDAALCDPDTTMSLQTRGLLTQYRQAYEFFTVPKQQAANTATPTLTPAPAMP